MDKVVVGDAVPGVLDEGFGKIASDGVGVGAALVANLQNGGIRRDAGGFDEAAEKEDIPLPAGNEEIRYVFQGAESWVEKENIIFKYEHVFGAAIQAAAQASQVRFVDALLAVGGVAGDGDELDAVQSGTAEFVGGGLPAVGACGKGDACLLYTSDAADE